MRGAMLQQIRRLSDKTRFIPSEGYYPRGFTVTGLHCGVKKDPTKLDLALIHSTAPCTAAAVFTQNKFTAAPVQVSRAVLEARQGAGIHSIVTNSGCANAVTGAEGLVNARKMGQAVERAAQWGSTSVSESDLPGSTLIMSTGVIGQPIPLPRIEDGIQRAFPALGRSHEHWLKFSQAYMTTDTFPKLRSRPFQLPSGTQYRMAGVSKGAGMIHPNMATLLGTIATDLPVSPACLQAALSYAVDRSFNAITIDGDTSTNDTVAILANGQTNSGNSLTIADQKSTDFVAFRDQLTEFARDLAQLVVRDGEGATKFITVRVKNAANFADAKSIATTIATSSLVKTAIYGQDANWGRIICAVGYTKDVAVDTQTISLQVIPMDGSAPLPLMVRGEPEKVDEARALEILKMEDINIEVDLGLGEATAEVYTCDMSHEYITINADYRS
ncbi:glutamate N-acetyltransferase [Dimargaris cristalligena]|uniref:Arginine biosynthesis bifunctional protein ArgJ, mitochondrial n=1 Tax=Dimargaris cristalligena TaxID=215637 RepID=A0A4Q0A0E2_9FUNG|nr:glutamate N-acetyltransferase [Dimargaris cristalligena]RKP39454.1 putative glutamate N-acetyltransferase precursor [Dimargaris cristalligena]|eukprot:RKP39454.1 putative glutamate N-acetyltransferase precursor [Dimargaris cristalligena]